MSTSHSASSFSGGTASVPVPEPSTVLLAAVAIVALLARWR
ncbi:MAG TPA: PEP-CTERM sorting domain-containing protein [Pirellulales bacterium]|nr:PEP-CTERM sorting domain-containing protein [Pirellulales bacterium]